MQLGFVSAILFDLGLEDVFAFAAGEGFGCVELMCWPPGAADRRYAGVTHLDVTKLSDDYVGHVRDLARRHGVGISGLGYYPNPLHSDADHRGYVIDHLKRVISAAHRLDINLVNTFIGRDPNKSVEKNWPRFQEVWAEIVPYAESEACAWGSRTAPCCSRWTSGPAGPTWRSARPSGGRSLKKSPAFIWA
jgi:sugar phosphate isomerase/epimerase